MTVDRKLKKSLRANLLILGDAALQYVREEAEREIKRRRLQVRERRKAKSEPQWIMPTVTITREEAEKLWPPRDPVMTNRKGDSNDRAQESVPA